MFSELDGEAPGGDSWSGEDRVLNWLNGLTTGLRALHSIKAECAACGAAPEWPSYGPATYRWDGKEHLLCTTCWLTETTKINIRITKRRDAKKISDAVVGALESEERASEERLRLLACARSYSVGRWNMIDACTANGSTPTAAAKKVDYWGECARQLGYWLYTWLEMADLKAENDENDGGLDFQDWTDEPAPARRGYRCSL